MLDGKKTYIGIALLLLGWLRWGNYVSEGDLTTIINNLTEVVGLAVAIYGRIVAKPQA